MLAPWKQSYDQPAAAKSLQLCPTVRPHRRQPTRLPHPWDSPDKNIGVGCRFLLQCMKVKSEVAQSCPTLSDPMDETSFAFCERAELRPRIYKRTIIFKEQVF